MVLTCGLIPVRPIYFRQHCKAVQQSAKQSGRHDGTLPEQRAVEPAAQSHLTFLAAAELGGLHQKQSSLSLLRHRQAMPHSSY